jgi:L-asparagine transporter-like permease
MSERATRDEGLERQLTTWHQAMIAIGGTVGVGLFLGSGATIGLAGPAVVLTYVVAAVVPLALGLVLAEMATEHPVSGSFGVYADRYLGSWAGFASRLTYWFAEILAIGAQVTAVGLYMRFWFPGVPTFVFMVAAALVGVGVNALNVGRFGALEAWLSLVKVVAIVAFILVGIALVLHVGGADSGASLANLRSDGGFFPNGLRGVWLSLTLVITSFLGIEAVAITAGEAARPDVSVPRALAGDVGTLVALYVLAMLVIVTVSPWRAVSETGGTLTESPFVAVFARAGVPFAASLMNFVVVSAALTAVLGHLYLATRMLYSLARAGYAPRAFGATDARGVPLRALVASTAGVALAVLLAARGHQVFLPMYGTGVAALLSIWILIFVSHLGFRRGLGEARRLELSYPVPWHPLPSIAGIALIVLALLATPFVPGLTWTVPMFGAWLLVVTGVYALRRRRLESAASERVR